MADESDWIKGGVHLPSPIEEPIRDKTLAEKLEERVSFTMTPEAEAQWNKKVLEAQDPAEEPDWADIGQLPSDVEPRTHEENFKKIEETLFHSSWEEGMKVEATGGLRQNVGKLRYDLVPPSWSEALAKVMTRNVEIGTYPARNWEKGLSYQDTLASLERHMVQLKKGEWSDAKTGLPHASMIAWNALALVEFNRRILAGTLPPELDDLPTDHWSY